MGEEKDEEGACMDKAVDFLKRNWWLLPVTLVTGYFGFYGGVIIILIFSLALNNTMLGFVIYSLLAGFFAMLPVLIKIGVSKRIEKRRKPVLILLTGLACAVFFFCDLDVFMIS